MASVGFSSTGWKGAMKMPKRSRFEGMGPPLSYLRYPMNARARGGKAGARDRPQPSLRATTTGCELERPPSTTIACPST